MAGTTVMNVWRKGGPGLPSASPYDVLDGVDEDDRANGTKEEYEQQSMLNQGVKAENEAREHKRLAKRRRVDEVEDTTDGPPVKSEAVEPEFQADEFNVEDLYLQGTVDDPAEMYVERSPTPERNAFEPLQNAPQVRRQAALSQVSMTNGATVYTFGPVDGVEVGEEFDSRDQARLANVHRASVKGIVGSQDIGCTSICVNGGYEDNEDTGYTIVYSGDGGKNPSGDEPGVDQTWTPMNRALFKSFKDHRPIRVLRGHKSKGRCAPIYGYRYDGLYQIIRCWISRSRSAGHYKTIKYAMQRLPKQPPIQKADKTYTEPEFLMNDLSGDWIKMPKHFHLITQDSNLIDPQVIQFDDEFGSMTPAELKEMRLKKKRKRAPNHSANRNSAVNGEHPGNSPSTDAPARSGRTFQSLEEDTESRAPQPQSQLWTAVNAIKDAFGNVITPIDPTLQQAPAAQNLENVDFHKNVNSNVYKQKFPNEDTKHALRGYMKWRTQCHSQQRVIENLDEVEAAVLKEQGEKNGTTT